MFDTIPDTTLDTTAFFLQRDAAAPTVDSFSTEFSLYEVIPSDSTGMTFRKDTAYTLQPKSIGKTGIAINYPQREASLFFLLFAFCFFIFSIFYRSAGRFMIDSLKSLFSFRNRNTTVHKEQVTTTEVWAEFFLLFQTTVILAMVAFIFFWDKGISVLPIFKRDGLFLGFFLFFAFFILFRYLIYRFFGAVFFPHHARDFSEKYLSVLQITGILAFLPALFFVFVPEYTLVASILLIIIFFINRLVVIVAILGIFVKARIGIFYFIVYLCAVEILPYFLLYLGPVSMINIVGNIVL
ncbi:MAG: DUF4271 domain-containing protein [Petrimonas sp.]|nr:DUF4271 domain-containing protein [Petrimonas sp.]